ncbi:hypothetical protein [Streptomyces ureilyticus]|uniref:Uncharacterized protein n=1 Tax=Streptomyces ureilyticus TaxID=1775131 RepID=A0ABX0DZA9_9ACTN|nr:hypothetical protein [Streptomyces ureilyticus]NGO45608.1 hypothetical protein [Streptomyces ureilyticus]
MPDPQITSDETDAQRGRERGVGERQAVDSLDRLAFEVGEDPQSLDAPAGSQFLVLAGRDATGCEAQLPADR